jgi:hypothetical protein
MRQPRFAFPKQNTSTSTQRSEANSPVSGGSSLERLLERGLSRTQALIRVKHLLRRPSAWPKAEHLIGLFNIKAEELLEQGIPLEWVKALEHRCQLEF